MKRKVYEKMLEWKAKYAGRHALSFVSTLTVPRFWT